MSTGRRCCASIGNRTVTAGQLLSFTINASDPDGGTLTFTPTGLPTGATLTPGANGIATFSWTPTAASGQRHSLLGDGRRERRAH